MEKLIREYDLNSDGSRLNTAEIQKAIDEVAESGGGRIVITAGTYLTGSLVLKSNVELHLEENALLLGSTDPEDYFNMDFPGRPESPKKDDNSQMALILAYNAQNIALTGNGEINGQGLELALAINEMHHQGVVVDPNYDFINMRPNETMRPKLVRFSQSSQIEIRDLKVGSSACWGLSFELCSDLNIDNLTVENMAYWNNDGIDITDCENVKISNCRINSADDGICLKSYYPGHCNNVVRISDCVIRSNASAVKFGTASYGGFKNISIENIEVYDTYRSAIAIESVDGGHIENIYVSNIKARNTGNAIFITLAHRDGKSPGSVKNICFKDMKVQVPFGRADKNYDLQALEPLAHSNPIPSSVTGLPGHLVENITLENIEIIMPGRASKGKAYVSLNRLDQIPEKISDYPEYDVFGELPAYGLYVRHGKWLTIKNFLLKLEDEDFRPAFVFDDVSEIEMSDIALPDNREMDEVILRDVKDYHIDSVAKITII